MEKKELLQGLNEKEQIILKETLNIERRFLNNAKVRDKEIISELSKMVKGTIKNED